MARKATSIFVSLTTTVWLAGVGTLVPFAAQADATTDALNAQIQQLLAQVAALQAQLAGTGSGGAGSAAKCAFTRALTVGSQGEDVKCLQQYLNSAGHQVAASGVGSPGNESMYFGNLTKAAVAKWQAANGVSPAVGYFGPISQAKYNAMGATTPPPLPPPLAKPQCSDGVDNDADTKIDYPSDTDCTDANDATEAAVATGTGLTVAVGTQPAATLAPQNAIHVIFTSFTLSASADGDVKVDSITVERAGLANDAVFAGLVLLDENKTPVTQVAKTLNSNHQAVLPDDFTVPKGTTKTYYLAGNMAASLTSYAGQVAMLSLVAVNPVSAQVTGALPISGTGHTINATLSVGSITLDRGGLDPGDVSPTKEVGTKDYVFTAFKATAGSNEDMTWKSIRFNQAGSAAKDDLKNVMIKDGAGNSYPVTMSADGKYYSATLGSGIDIKKGANAEVYIVAEIAGGSNRTIDFDLYRYDDAVFEGKTFAYKIQPTGTNEKTSSLNANDARFQNAEPRFDADRVTIGAGSIRVEKTNNVAAGNIANGAENAALGSFLFEVKGESVSFTAWTVTVTTTDNDSGAEAAKITQFTAYDANGKAIAGPKDATNATTVSFTDTITLPVGSNIITVKGRLNTNWENNDTVQLSFTPSSALSSVKGSETGTTITPTPSASVAGNTQTVKAGSLVISPSSSLAAQTYIEGSNDAEIGRFTFDASNSGEDVKVTIAKFHANMDTAPTSDINNFASLRLFDGTKQLNTGSNVLEPAATADGTDGTQTITLDSPGFIIPKGTTKVISLKANLTTGFDVGDVSQFDFVGLADGDWTVTGMSTNSELTEDLDIVTTGSTITMQTGGGWSVAVAPSSPQEKWVAAGSTGVVLNILRFNATSEDFALTDLRLEIDTTGSSTAGDFAAIHLYDGTKLLLTKTSPAFTNGVEDFNLPASGDTTFIIPRDSYREMTIKADLAGIGTSLSGTAGELVGVDYDGTTNATKNKAIGKSSGSSVHSSTASDQTSNGVVMFRSLPTLERLPIPVTALTSGNHVLYKFQVKADPAYDIALRQFTFQVSTTGVTGLGGSVPSFTLRNVTDGNKRMSAATGAAAEFFSDLARYSNGTGTLVFNIVADTTDYSTAYIPIPKGQTHVFELRGDVTTDGANDSVTTKLLGDNARPVLVSLTGSTAKKMVKISQIDSFSGGLIAGDSYSKRPAQANSPTSTAFIWSDYSSDATATHGVNTADWMNGFKVPGLLSTGLDASTLSN